MAAAFDSVLEQAWADPPEALARRLPTGTPVPRPARQLAALTGHPQADAAADTAAMLDVAAAGKMHGSQAGTWVEVARGDCRLALCQLAADDQGACRSILATLKALAR